MTRRQWSIRSSAAIAALLLTAAFAGGAAAQPSAPQPSAAGAAKPEIREKVKQKILAFRAFRLTEELNLDEAAAARVFPLLTKYDQQIEQLTVERVTLNRALRNPPAGAKAADELIRRALANRRAFLDLEEQRINELRKVLSPEQTVRLLVVLPEIERQIKEQIRRAVRKAGRADPLDPFTPRKGKRAGQRANPYNDPDEIE
jgi:Spy/CpxP family protein refolding chaperone